MVRGGMHAVGKLEAQTDGAVFRVCAARREQMRTKRVNIIVSFGFTCYTLSVFSSLIIKSWRRLFFHFVALRERERGIILVSSPRTAARQQGLERYVPPAVLSVQLHETLLFETVGCVGKRVEAFFPFA